VTKELSVSQIDACASLPAGTSAGKHQSWTRPPRHCSDTADDIHRLHTYQLSSHIKWTSEGFIKKACTFWPACTTCIAYCLNHLKSCTGHTHGYYSVAHNYDNHGDLPTANSTTSQQENHVPSTCCALVVRLDNHSAFQHDD
jgi:hypothetical protein